MIIDPISERITAGDATGAFTCPNPNWTERVQRHHGHWLHVHSYVRWAHRASHQGHRLVTLGKAAEPRERGRALVLTPRPFFLPLFTGLRGRGILRSSPSLGPLPMSIPG